ncbi:MAG: ion transporter [Bacteroidota bacterium]
MKKQSWTKFFTDDRPVAVVISLNAIVLFLLSFEEFEKSHLLEILDSLFLFYFMLEALLKIRQMGWDSYISNGWNRFDFIIVVLSIPSLILLFEVFDMLKTDKTDFTFLFIFRIVRIIRFFKFIKFIPNIQELLAGITRAFKASVFVLLTFFVFSFIVSLISCRMYQKIHPDMFSDPLIAFYHTFRVFTIEGWYEVPEEIIKAGEENDTLGKMGIFFTRLYFIIILISGGLIGLSIVNAIFVEEMVRDNNDDIILKMKKMEEKMDLLIEVQRKMSLPPPTDKSSSSHPNPDLEE